MKILYCIARLKGRNLKIMYSSFDKKERDDIIDQMYNQWHTDYSNVEPLYITVGFNNTEFNKGYNK